jgi:hypothetical protein
MPSKKKPAKKVPAKKKVAKKAPAKKPSAAKKKTVAAKQKPPARAKKKPARAKSVKTGTPLPEGVTRVEVSILQINEIAPVDLDIKDVSGTPRVFYGTTEVDTQIDDIFPANTTLTSVEWHVTNKAPYTVDVTFGSGSPIPLTRGASTSDTLSMPGVYACNGTNLFVQKDGELKHDPVIKLKRKDSTGQIPNC